jgi:hypothetical protein
MQTENEMHRRFVQFNVAAKFPQLLYQQALKVQVVHLPAPVLDIDLRLGTSGFLLSGLLGAHQQSAIAHRLNTALRNFDVNRRDRRTRPALVEFIEIFGSCALRDWANAAWKVGLECTRSDVPSLAGTRVSSSVTSSSSRARSSSLVLPDSRLPEQSCSFRATHG